VLKINFADFDEAIFHDVEKPLERIFKILGIENSDLD
jgi:shikimate kinase